MNCILGCQGTPERPCVSVVLFSGGESRWPMTWQAKTGLDDRKKECASRDEGPAVKGKDLGKNE